MWRRLQGVGLLRDHGKVRLFSSGIGANLAWCHRQGRRRSPVEEGKARGGTERERAVERAVGWGGERGRCPTGCRTEKVCGGIDLILWDEMRVCRARRQAVERLMGRGTKLPLRP